MSHNFKPGDLALTLVDRDWPAFCVVTLHTFVPEGRTAVETSGFRWVSRGEWVVFREGDSIADTYFPSELMPLKGDFSLDQQKSREVSA